MTDGLACAGCQLEVPANYRGACSECGAPCPACRHCAATSAPLTCDPCFDAQLPFLAAYIRFRLAVSLN